VHLGQGLAAFFERREIYAADGLDFVGLVREVLQHGHKISHKRPIPSLCNCLINAHRGDYLTV
jgi:hypothetical protein